MNFRLPKKSHFNYQKFKTYSKKNKECFKKNLIEFKGICRGWVKIIYKVLMNNIQLCSAKIHIK